MTIYNERLLHKVAGEMRDYKKNNSRDERLLWGGFD